MNADWHVYIVCCVDNTLYTGISNNVERRVKEHNAGTRGARYTRTRRPVRLLFTEGPMTQSDALRREHLLKSKTRAEKLTLIGGGDQNGPDCGVVSAS